MRILPLLPLLLLVPLAGCLESPCSRYGDLCADGGDGFDRPVTCTVMPQVATGTLAPAGEDTADIWALRVSEEFEDVQVLTDDEGWDPAGRAWTTPADVDAGDADCTCGSAEGCPSMQVLIDQPAWVFVEVHDYTNAPGLARDYTLHAEGVLSALRIRKGVERESDVADYGTAPPGLCERSRIGSDVQLPWISAPDDDYPLDLGPLRDPGICVQARITVCTDEFDRFPFEKTDGNPTRVTLVWDGEADLDLQANPGGSSLTENNPETFVASLANGATSTVIVTCFSGMPPIPYAVALETY